MPNPTVLYIPASPRPTTSYSTQVAEAFLEAYSSVRPETIVDKLDLWQTSLPEFSGDMLESKYAIMHQNAATPAQAAAWSEVETHFKRFADADTYVISTPMWNFSIPYKLKHYIDIIAQPGLAFGFDRDRGYYGLLEGKRAVIVCARGDAYPPGSDIESIDFQKPYLRHMLGFFGIDDVRQVVIEPTIADGQRQLEEARSRAIALAQELGQPDKTSQVSS